MKIAKLVFLFLLTAITASAQNSPTIDTSAIAAPKNIKFNYKQLIIPSLLIGYGVVGLGSDGLQGWNIDIRNEVVEDIDKKLTIDDFLQYTPAVSVYALNAFGVKGKNNFKDRSIVLGTSMVFVFTTVTALKKITKEERPDGSNNASFPSGHTALAFAGAEFLYQEYKDVSVWYGVAGYAAATTTGLFRIYNNKHWLTDVVAGAGFGILSTKAAYWLQPYISKHIFGSSANKSTGALFAPYYDGKQMGGSFVMSF
ncbi:MAG TPA: phosphatase PAP2 family protein [Flavobacterium sp.]|uniref:phosphatase PAP2 family protein n=1 Tax=Flavobacterium sp. TaxID=239 RepID=UPI002C96201C|nr:phosphatase PAP2 family protein [Flavobacterium sp.]HNP33904.1 phosphatase PAP2 family protein [Flavobacterium sp.]